MADLGGNRRGAGRHPVGWTSMVPYPVWSSALTSGRVILAVLPFKNLTGDSGRNI